AIRPTLRKAIRTLKRATCASSLRWRCRPAATAWTRSAASSPARRRTCNPAAGCCWNTAGSRARRCVRCCRRPASMPGRPRGTWNSATASRTAATIAESHVAESPEEHAMRTLYPEIEPYDTGTLEVDARHKLYYEQCGNPEGKPVVLLHGGPGGGCSAKMRRFHDPAKYRIILFDQRGAGRSTPHADLVANTTWDLVADIEKLRKRLGVDKWQVFG